MSSDPSAPRPGAIAWQDLKVDDAEAVRDFYRHVELQAERA